MDLRDRELPEAVSGTVPVLSLTKNFGLIPQSQRFEKRIALSDTSNYKVVRRGHVVYNPYVIWEGAVHVLHEPEIGLVSPVYPVWQADCHRADPVFLDLLLRLPDAIKQYNKYAAGAVNRRRSISKRDFLSVQVPLPSIPEQRAIAGVLSAVRRAIEATEAVIEAAQRFKKSLMRHLFTYGPVPIGAISELQLGETELGPTPEGWAVKKLAEVCEKPQYGYTASANAERVGPHLLRITDIQDDTVVWSSVPFCECGDHDREKYRLELDDLLVARIGATTGKTYLVREEVDAVFASYLIRIRTQSGLLPSYLMHFTRTNGYWDQINANKGGRLKQGVNIPVLQNIRIAVPSLDVQAQMACLLSSLDGKLAAESSRLNALEVLFGSLLEALMTGHLRLQSDSQ